MKTSASAPGKVMIAGEYAVLYGAPAVVAAVTRRAYSRPAHDSGERSDGSGPAGAGSRGVFVWGPEVVLARTLAERAMGNVSGDMVLDTGELREHGLKLGLGSSAAGAVATVAHVFAEHGVAIETAEGRARMFPIALEAHRSIAPEGSGADVAASTFGGFVRIEKGERTTTRSIDGWDALEWCVVWTGKEARTSEFVARVRACTSPAIDAIRDHAAALASALEARDAARAIQAVAAHHRAMAALGDDAGAPIVEEKLAAIARIAEAHGGAAKPSGAGGGDVAVAVFAEGSDVQAFRSACASAGLTVLSVGLGAEGARRE
jgi:phosphomevalonate kinase